MKKVNIFLFALLCCFTYAQHYKVIYSLFWKPSLQNDTILTGLTALIINGKKSYFADYNKFKADSVKSKMVSDFFSGNQQGNLRFPSPKADARFKKVIIKDIENGITIQEEKFYITTFHVISECKLKWSLEKGEETIFGYMTKKAVAKLGGKKWTVWYTTEIPINDGPYKLYGLPGLILKATDEKGDYTFEVAGITNETNDLEYRNFSLPAPVVLNDKKWDKFYKSYKQQPSIVLENLNTESTTYVIDGKDIDQHTKSDYDRKEKSYLYENNNEIELFNSCNK